MDKVRGFWKPALAFAPTAKSGSRPAKNGKATASDLKDSRVTNTIAHNPRPESAGYGRSSIGNPLTSSDNTKPKTVQSSGYCTADAEYLATSALDCPRTQTMRDIERRAQDLIASSLSTVDDNKEEAAKYKCLDLQRGGIKASQYAPDEDTTGQGAGNLSIPQNAELLTTYSGSDESLVEVQLEISIIDDSLVRQKTYDLRALDQSLIDVDQRGQLNRTEHQIRFPFAEELDESSDEDEAEELSFAMDHEADDMDNLALPRSYGPRYADSKITVQKPLVLQVSKNLVRAHRAQVKDGERAGGELYIDGNHFG